MSLIQTGRSLPSYGIAAVGAGIYLGRMSRNAGGDYVIGIRITAAAGIVEMHKGLQIQPDITRLDELVSGYEEGRFSLPRGALQSAVSLTERDYRGLRWKLSPLSAKQTSG